jgi:hypothetical protein
VIYDPEGVARLEALFHEDLGQTEEVALETWRRRSVVTKVKEGVGRLMSPLL